MEEKFSSSDSVTPGCKNEYHLKRNDDVDEPLSEDDSNSCLYQDLFLDNTTDDQEQVEVLKEKKEKLDRLRNEHKQLEMEKAKLSEEVNVGIKNLHSCLVMARCRVHRCEVDFKNEQAFLGFQCDGVCPGCSTVIVQDRSNVPRPQYVTFLNPANAVRLQFRSSESMKQWFAEHGILKSADGLPVSFEGDPLYFYTGETTVSLRDVQSSIIR
ncbi:hypothetical protein T4B_13059 [Trichinella pseudospiralis]|uniref:Uncharacterized protein n=1 Tax=Trichinella pseudospiralis TaxID=6337 RepID=A0A0V1DZQ3_TRIPS|nr:hypothetical protein T4A_10903 [Trichinella pseudospiralis]KRZ22214.1 hypothetical protein T4B_13059 [Trichinella pseudospiralis]KRZ24139.1 hypothetical protein T4C_14100 [Trichinella pseudospiralis]